MPDTPNLTAAGAVEHPDPADLSLLALGEAASDEVPEGVSAEVTAHVVDCASCRSELESLRRVVTSARAITDEDEPVAPPASVWAGITAQLAADLAADQETAGNTSAADTDKSRDAATPAPVRELSSARSVRDSRPRHFNWALAAAACLIGILVGGLAVGVSNRPADEPTRLVATADLQPLEGSIAAGRAEFVEGPEGRQVRLGLTGLNSGLNGGEADAYYEAWLLDPATLKLVSLGGLPRAGEDGEVLLPVPAGVDLGAYPAVDVSREPLDGDPRHSGDSIARGLIRI